MRIRRVTAIGTLAAVATAGVTAVVLLQPSDTDRSPAPTSQPSQGRGLSAADQKKLDELTEQKNALQQEFQSVSDSIAKRLEDVRR